MSEREQDSSTPKPPKEAPAAKLTEAQRIRQRIDKVGKYPLLEVRKRFIFGAPGKNDPLGPEHLFVPTLRETLLVPAIDELARTRELIADTIGIRIGSVAAPRGVQVLVGVMHNEGVRRQKAEDELLVREDPNADMIISVARLSQGLDYIERELQKLPDEKRRALTMLDLVDNVLLTILQKKAQEESKRKNPKQDK